MALDNHVWAPVTPMPMAESALYRQRLEVIAEKRRLQEAIRAARRELEEEKLRVQRLKRKTLRDRWLMDGAAEEPEGQEDPPTPETQAQARIQSLEDSLFTLQAQLQLLQSASTGALHRPASRPVWRRQGQRPLSQPPVEPAAPAGQADQDKRASLPTGLAGTECPLGPGQVPGAAEASSEANGHDLGPSPAPAPEGSVDEGAGGEDSGMGVVEVVWEGLRATEDSPGEPTGAELEARVEAMVLEAIGERLDAGGPDLPAWVRDDRAVVEVVWEGVGGDLEVRGEPGGDPKEASLSSPRLPENLRRGSPDGARQGGHGGEDGAFIWVERVTVTEDWEELGLEGPEGPLDSGGAASWELERRQAEERGARGGSEDVPEEEASGGEETRVAKGRRDEGAACAERGGEETQGPEATGGEERGEAAGGSPGAPGGEGGEELLRGAREGGEERGEAAGGSLGVLGGEGGEELLRGAREGGEERGEAAGGSLGVPGGGAEELLRETREGGEELSQAGRKGGEELLKARGGEERGEAAGSPGVPRGEGGEELLQAGREGGEELLEVTSKAGEGLLRAERVRGEESLKVASKGGEEALKAPREGGEESPEADRGGGEELLQAGSGGEEVLKESAGGEAAMQAEDSGDRAAFQSEETPDLEKDFSAGQRASGEGLGGPGELEGGAAPRAREEPTQETEAQPPQKTTEDCLKEEAASGKPQPPAEGPSPSGNAAPLVEVTPAPAEQPPECQPLLQAKGPRTNPSAHPVPSYAPARQPPPSAAAPEGSETSAPKQKTCQCCAVM